MGALQQILDRASSLEGLTHAYSDYVAEVMRRVDAGAVERFATLLEEVDSAGGTIYLIGNGGAAAAASHFETDLSLGLRRDGLQGLRAVSLTDNAPVLTAAANDLGYGEVFVAQLEPRLAQADLLVAISASGNSENVLRAVEYATTVGAATAALVGFDGGRLLRLVDHAVHIPTEIGEFGPVEDAFSLLDHVVTAGLAGRRQAAVTAPGAPAVTPPR